MSKELALDSQRWPQSPTRKAVEAVASTAVQFRTVRARLMAEHNLCLRELYRSLEQPGDHPLKEAQSDLDDAVRQAYSFRASADILSSLLALNISLAADEAAGKPILGPGLPPMIKDRAKFVTADCVSAT